VGPRGDAYHVWPLFTGVGGGLFGRHPDGAWDAQRVLLGESGPAFEKLRALGEQGERILQPDLDREQAIEAFVRGRTAFLICASRALGDIAAANADRVPGTPPLSVAVSPVPPFAGRDRGPSLVSVYGFYVPVNGMNKALSRDLVGDYLAQPDVAASLSRVQRRPSAHVGSSAADPAVAAFAAECRRGQVMPAFPFMKDVWKAFGETERRVISGADPHRSADALDRTVRRIVARRTS
jgi:arabinogalactan oligomer/maltooligosaccharide transport system substrate-binding protein